MQITSKSPNYVCVCVHVSALMWFMATFTMLVHSVQTLPSCLSDEIKDKLLPLNPLIEEMSLISDKPFT